MKAKADPNLTSDGTLKMLTDAESRLLVMAWPVERPDSNLTPEAASLVERGAMYLEPIGNGWYRHGLTPWGQSLADNTRDPFRRARRAAARR